MDIDKNYIKEIIGTSAVILDIGSYDGKDALELADICETEVHCFEPNPASYEIMKLLGNNNLILWNYAVCAFNGMTVLNLSNHPQRDSIKTPKSSDVIYSDTVPVKTTTLDAWNWHVRKGAPIDFIWCDVNGAEADFIVGAVETLKITRYLYIEYCEKELFNKALNRKGIIETLEGFEVLGDYNFMGSYGNLLFKNKNIQL